MSGDSRHIRVPDEIWDPAKARTFAEGTNLTTIIKAFLRDYVSAPPMGLSGGYEVVDCGGRQVPEGKKVTDSIRGEEFTYQQAIDTGRIVVVDSVGVAHRVHPGVFGLVVKKMEDK
jgi:hypothetical protein